jgi:hypothetical protein
LKLALRLVRRIDGHHEDFGKYVCITFKLFARLAELLLGEALSKLQIEVQIAWRCMTSSTRLSLARI